MTSSSNVPSFIGYVKTTVNALRLIHAARQGVIPRITRPLNDCERRTMIQSGAVFIFCTQESQINSWTDELFWSPSCAVDNFLVYREINERTSSCSDQGTFKVGGLIKKTITVLMQESSPEPTHLQLISYYTLEDIRSGKLKTLWTRQDIMDLYMPPHIFCLTTFRIPPKVEIGPDGKPRLVNDYDLYPPNSPAIQNEDNTQTDKPINLYHCTVHLASSIKNITMTDSANHVPQVIYHHPRIIGKKGDGMLHPQPSAVFKYDPSTSMDLPPCSGRTRISFSVDHVLLFRVALVTVSCLVFLGFVVLGK